MTPSRSTRILAVLFSATAVFAIQPSASAQAAAALQLHPQVTGTHFAGFEIEDTLSHRTLHATDAFVLVLKDKTELRSSQMQATPLDAKLNAADPDNVQDPHRIFRGAAASPAPATTCWNFQHPGLDAKLQWCILARPNADYARVLLRIQAGAHDLPIAEVRMLDLHDPGAHVSGTVQGSPIVDANLYFGAEHPLSTSAVRGDRATASLFRDLPLRAHQSITYSAVLGTAHPGQLRRAFLAYIEAERPRPYQPFLHYNSWFDIGYENRFGEAAVLDRIQAFGTQLHDDRHVQLDSFLFDDGWDDPSSLWGFNAQLPNGFAKADAAAKAYNAGVGVWLSPWGGYAHEKDQRIAYGHAHNYEILNDGYALSGPKYFARFEQTCLDMIDKYHVNQFKFDGTGNADRVFPGSAFDSDFDAAIHLIERLRQEKQSIFINLTTGTTASPFWLFYADSIWRGGDDTDFSGVGTKRQRWITYRDAQTYKNIVQQGPLFPLNSLMLHGIVYATQARDLATDPAGDFADEVHSYFGSGTQLQELYITPSLLTPANWDTLAEAARWSRAHAGTLKDVHWIGGDPDKLVPYGWAAWSAHDAILTLRNPSASAQTIAIDPATAFELQPDAPKSFTMHPLWSGAHNKQPIQLHAGQTHSITLEPFEVLTLVSAEQ